MHLRLTDYILWFATPCLQVGVLISLFRRGLHRDYPYFFNYTILQVVSVPVLFVISLQFVHHLLLRLLRKYRA